MEHKTEMRYAASKGVQLACSCRRSICLDSNVVARESDDKADFAVHKLLAPRRCSPVKYGET
jgi:hypothetical protein